MRHARLGWILAGLGAIGLASWAQGCLFAPDDCADLLKCTGAGGSLGTGSTGVSSSSGSVSGSGGSGGDAVTSASSASASGSTGTGAVTSCTTAADCGGTNTLCGDYTCISGHCALHQAQPDGNSYSQLYGDCHVAKCQKAKLVSEENKTDVYDDGNPCTDDTCINGAPVNTIKAGLPCGTTGVCNGQGACVECINGNTGNCGSSNPVCLDGHCSPVACNDGLQDNGESDKDCGGSCAPCDDGKYCELPSDCVSGVCMKPSGENKLKCTVPSCSDGVKNDLETDTDCGGPNCATKCQPVKKCSVGSDCNSGVCQSGICQAPTCADGVKNGAETGIDCGDATQGCPKCPGG